MSASRLWFRVRRTKALLVELFVTVYAFTAVPNILNVTNVVGSQVANTASGNINSTSERYFPASASLHFALN